MRQARAEVIRLSARYGIEALVNPEAKRRTMRGFRIATAKLAAPVKATGCQHAIERCAFRAGEIP